MFAVAIAELGPHTDESLSALAHALGLPVPELALVDVAAPLGRAEPDPEVRDLLLASVGSNAGLAHLPAGARLQCNPP